MEIFRHLFRIFNFTSKFSLEEILRKNPQQNSRENEFRVDCQATTRPDKHGRVVLYFVKSNAIVCTTVHQ